MVHHLNSKTLCMDVARTKHYILADLSDMTTWVSTSMDFSFTSSINHCARTIDGTLLTTAQLRRLKNSPYTPYERQPSTTRTWWLPSTTSGIFLWAVSAVPSSSINVTPRLTWRGLSTVMS